MSAHPPALRFGCRQAVQVLALLVAATSLHVVPQWLAPRFDAALTMVALMAVDAAVFAALMRTGAWWKTAALLAALFVAESVLRSQHLAALPSVALNLALAAAFAATLRRGRTPLVQAIAVHALGVATVDAAFARYLRGITCAWAIFFLAMAALSALLALTAPFAWWSLFANVLSWPLVALMFVAEYVWRRIRHPALPAHTPLQTLASALAYPLTAARGFLGAPR